MRLFQARPLPSDAVDCAIPMGNYLPGRPKGHEPATPEQNFYLRQLDISRDVSVTLFADSMRSLEVEGKWPDLVGGCRMVGTFLSYDSLGW